MVGIDAARLVGVAIGVMGVVAALIAAVRVRDERPLARGPLVIGATGLAATAALAVLLPPISFKTAVLWGLLAGGALIGLMAGLLVRVRHNRGGVLIRGGSWHLLPASLALLLLQLAGLSSSIDAVVVATASLVGAATFAVAAASTVLARGAVAGLRSEPIPTSSSAAAVVGPARASKVPGPRTAPVAIACSACGRPVSVGWRHCVSCGAALAWDTSGR